MRDRRASRVRIRPARPRMPRGALVALVALALVATPAAAVAAADQDAALAPLDALESIADDAAAAGGHDSLVGDGGSLSALAEGGGGADPPAANAPAVLADVHCALDAAGDTFVEDADGRVPVAEPRADLRQVCAEYGEQLTLRLRLDEPTDPATHPSWAGATRAAWFLDLDGDGAFDRAVDYRRVGAEPQALMQRRDDAGGWEPLPGCDATPGFDTPSGELRATGIADGCLDDAARIEVAAVMAFDPDPADPAAAVVYDAAQWRLAVGRAGAPPLRATDRLAGGDRYETAAAIARARYPARADVVYLARGDAFADALAAGALDTRPGSAGPVLLVPSCDVLPAAVTDAIARFDPDEVVVLGGQAAVCEQVLDEAAGAGGRQRATMRLTEPEEATRYGTAVAIARRAYPDGGAEEVYLATGEAFPDALAAGSLERGPTLLVPSCGQLPPVVADELDRLGPQRVVTLGGEQAVCEEVRQAAVAAAGGGDGGRLAGRTRFDTAAEIARYRYPAGAPRVYVARADDFPDALAGGVLDDGPILLVPACGDLPQPVAAELRRLAPTEIVALGGRGAVCDTMLRHAANA